MPNIKIFCHPIVLTHLELPHLPAPRAALSTWFSFSIAHLHFPSVAGCSFISRLRRPATATPSRWSPSPTTPAVRAMPLSIYDDPRTPTERSRLHRRSHLFYRVQLFGDRMTLLWDERGARCGGHAGRVVGSSLPRWPYGTCICGTMRWRSGRYAVVCAGATVEALLGPWMLLPLIRH